jgi:hypothetical protein
MDDHHLFVGTGPVNAGVTRGLTLAPSEFEGTPRPDGTEA